MFGTVKSFGHTLVLAPHPDDETLGAGGTIARLSQAGLVVDVAVVTSGRPPDFPEEQIATVRQEASRAHALLGVKNTFWLDLPAARLTEISRPALNAAVGGLLRRCRPDTVLLPFPGDIHVDHQLVFEAAMVAARPHHPEYPTTLLAYETLSETNWNAPYLSAGFHPNIFIDIADTLTLKLKAMAAYESQGRASPHERSIKALEALARLRGATVHRQAAEGFVLVRSVVHA